VQIYQFQINLICLAKNNNFDMQNQILISVPIFPVCMFFLNEMCKN
jgi:hypothetical protein